MPLTTHQQHNNISGGNNNNNFANGTQNIHKGRDWLQNNSTGQINVNNYGQEDSDDDDDDDDDDEDRPLSPRKLQKELKAFKRQRFGELDDDELRKIDGQECLARCQRMIISDCPGKILSPIDKSAILDAMIRLCEVFGLSPKCLRIQDIGITDLDTVLLPSVEGEHSMEMEIFKGKIDELDVTVKALKTRPGPGDKELEMLLKHALTLLKLDHGNIVPFLGLDYFDEDRSRVCLVYRWIEQLSIDEHIPDNREEIGGIIGGLEHLHSKRVIHGDLRPSNLLVPQGEAPRIADLGLAQLLGKAADKDVKSDRYQCARVLYEEAQGIIGGLEHLHSKRVIHGDLRPSNLLVPQGEAPRIADLGLAQLLGKAADKDVKSDRYQCARVLYEEVSTLPACVMISCFINLTLSLGVWG
ncbi:hypothetical protein PQX77_021001 [Marasmius sp. AFHP31]|nr:hypothetical protein PQX77_021001 [Marasmius sp. AFHP31]